MYLIILDSLWGLPHHVFVSSTKLKGFSDITVSTPITVLASKISTRFFLHCHGSVLEWSRMSNPLPFYPEMGTSLMANVLRASFLLFRAEIFTVETSK